ncbi:YkgJ family cysteine cluster protein [Candidatus Falkowbacteria bacterium]|nr:YkgJ family cysteine cluster protein [Candidatus Falkowbacteria bacterium]
MDNGIEKENICRKHECSVCCRPVKVRRGFKSHFGERMKDLPFKEREEIWIPKEHPDTVRLEAYDCALFDEKTGLCKDYEKRPSVCRDTQCRAFETDNANEQKKIIEKNKTEKFYICKK